MDKLTLRKRFSAAALAAALALAVCVPATAFATTPSAQDGSESNPGNTTTLTLQYDVPLDVTNYSGAVSNTKVLVPAKINFVANPSSNSIAGPTDAVIKNYSSYKVHISNINLTGTSGSVTFTKDTITSSSNANLVNLSVKPGNAAAVNFDDLDGGYNVTDGSWNLAAGSTSSPTELAITFPDGQCSSSLTTIDPNTQATIGTIGWTVAAGNLSTVSGG